MLMHRGMLRGVAVAAGLGLSASLAGMLPAAAQDDTIKVGILHSLSGTMAISRRR